MLYFFKCNETSENLTYAYSKMASFVKHLQYNLGHTWCLLALPPSLLDLPPQRKIKYYIQQIIFMWPPGKSAYPYYREVVVQGSTILRGNTTQQLSAQTLEPYWLCSNPKSITYQHSGQVVYFMLNFFICEMGIIVHLSQELTGVKCLNYFLAHNECYSSVKFDYHHHYHYCHHTKIRKIVAW